MYDLIGDIHGHADELIQLLGALGYEMRNGVYRHPERKVIFLGDFIDRGPQIKQVLEIVRPMVESEHALSVMGNHELNALAFHAEDQDAPGEYLRRRSPANQNQHRATLEQLNSAELASYLGWFRTLPLWLNLDGLRAIHACWDERSIAAIALALDGTVQFTNELLHASCRPGKPLFAAVETILKGKETLLPDGLSFADRYGHIRHSARVRWFLPPGGQTYRTYLLSDKIDCDLAISAECAAEATPYAIDAKPVFIGHYWLSAKRPEILAPNVACLDYSVAKDGYLCAYRWNGEQRLSNENFVWIDKHR